MSTTATAAEYAPGLEASGERADLLATSADNAEGTQIIAIYGKGGIGKTCVFSSDFQLQFGSFTLWCCHINLFLQFNDFLA